MSLAYANYFQRLESILCESAAVLQSSEYSSRDSVIEKVASLQANLRFDGPLRVALVGEFSSGKSSIISALTGADLLIDADVATTATSDYPWQGLVLVDTPGVQAEGALTDHDRIAREATIGADLVLFVITNELFHPRLAAHLNFVIGHDGLDLAKKTCIILNKMDRETNVDEVVIGEVTKVLDPYLDVPVFLCSASKFLQSKKEEGPLRDRFERQSRFRTLIDGLNGFVDDSGVNGRLATPLSVLSDLLDGLQSELVETDEDRMGLELVRRQMVILQRLQKRLIEIRKSWKQRAFSSVIGQANDAVEQITETTDADGLSALLETGLKMAAAQIDEHYDGVEADIQEALARATVDFDEVGGSPLGQKVMQIELAKGDRVQVPLGSSGSRPDDKFYKAKFAKAAREPLEKALQGMSSKSKELRDVVHKWGTAMGKKFRPWEAVKGGEKLAKYAGRASKALPFLAVALDFYIQYREEKAAEEKARYLASIRLNLRNAFVDQAKVEAEAIEVAVKAVAYGSIKELQEELDGKAETITRGGKEKSELLQEIAGIKKQVAVLRQDLYQG